jgi:hypothetical protein
MYRDIYIFSFLNTVIVFREFIDLRKLITKSERKIHSIELIGQKSTNHSVAIDKQEKFKAQPLTNNKPGFNNQELDYLPPHTRYAISDVLQIILNK